MNRIDRRISALLALMAPIAALAAPSAQQDFADAARLQADLTRGAVLYAECARCHGADGRGEAVNAPRIAGQHPRVVMRQLIDYRYARRQDPRMERVADGHLLERAQDIADVAAYAASLEPRSATTSGPGDHLPQGQQVYNARCSSCHGRAGEGNEAMLAPKLAGQHYAYLLRQLHDALEGRRPKLAESHDAFLRDLDRDALQGLADLLSRSGG